MGLYFWILEDVASPYQHSDVCFISGFYLEDSLIELDSCLKGKSEVFRNEAHPEPKYLSGTCLLTRVAGHGTGITLGDLLVKESLQRAILCSSRVDRDWLEAFLKPEVPVCLVENGGGNSFTVAPGPLGF